jgi:hypothetical protein
VNYDKFMTGYLFITHKTVHGAQLKWEIKNVNSFYEMLTKLYLNLI